MATRQCPFCGMGVSDFLNRCPFCRETIPEVHLASQPVAVGQERIRRGLLCMLLAAVIHYFAGGYSKMQLPFPIDPIVTVYLSPLLLLCGLGLTLYGFHYRGHVLRHR